MEGEEVLSFQVAFTSKESTSDLAKCIQSISLIEKLYDCKLNVLI
jgi:hypothetical protein